MKKDIINAWIWLRNHWELFAWYEACSKAKFMFDKPIPRSYKK